MQADNLVFLSAINIPNQKALKKQLREEEEIKVGRVTEVTDGARRRMGEVLFCSARPRIAE